VGSTGADPSSRGHADKVRDAVVRTSRSAPLSFAGPRSSLSGVWTNRRYFGPPSVPNLDALPEEVEMLWVGHQPRSPAATLATLRR
jgi:hypothetical protein